MKLSDYEYYKNGMGVLYCGDVREILPLIEPGSIQTCVTSPPYWNLRDYLEKDQLGLEKTPEEYVEKMTSVFELVRAALKDDGCLWLNLGDTYAASRSYQVVDNKYKDVGNKIGHTVPPGLHQKTLIGIPWRTAFSLQSSGWILRQDIIWHKPNPMPESVKDRCTKAHEYIFLMSKKGRYYWDADAISEKAVGAHAHGGGATVIPDRNENHGQLDRTWGGKTRNRRSVWTVTTKPYAGAHFATFPQKLIQPCVLAGSRTMDIVLDPFMGAGTTAVVSEKLGRKWVGIELSPEYAELAKKRIEQERQQLRMF